MSTQQVLERAGTAPGPLGEAVARLRRAPWSGAAVYVGFVVVFAYFAITLSDRGFLTGHNFLTILQQTAPITVMACATVFVLSAAEIDLSIGATVALSAVVGAQAVNSFGAPAGAAIGFAVGVLAGLLNGTLVVALRVPSFLITLGTTELFAGATEIFSRLQDIPVSNVGFATIFGTGAFASLPVALLWSVAALVVAHLTLRWTAFGQRVLATGDNRVSARAVGINTSRVRIAVLAVSGGAAGLAGLIYTGQIQGAIYTLGVNDMLATLAAVVIGGTTLRGGYGSVVGAFVGSILMGVIRNGLLLAGLTASQQTLVTGLIIVLAVAISQREKA